MNALASYKQQAALDTPQELSRKVLKSIELYMVDAQNGQLEQQQRLESGLNAITLTQALSQSIRDDLPEEEQVIIIKVCGQIIKNVHKYMRGHQQDLSKELAGVRLIHKLIT